MIERERPTDKAAPPAKSDRDCFSVLADAPRQALPSCYRCSAPAMGARVVALDPATIGKPSGTFRFTCGCDGDTSYALTADTLYPRWQVVRHIDKGLAYLRHLSETEAIKRVRGAN